MCLFLRVLVFWIGVIALQGCQHQQAQTKNQFLMQPENIRPTLEQCEFALIMSPRCQAARAALSELVVLSEQLARDATVVGTRIMHIQVQLANVNQQLSVSNLSVETQTKLQHKHQQLTQQLQALYAMINFLQQQP
ncbi:MAG: hypothetical protein Tsb005_06200 [Gammaproteobacteria bacterium]